MYDTNIDESDYVDIGNLEDLDAVPSPFPDDPSFKQYIKDGLWIIETTCNGALYKLHDKDKEVCINKYLTYKRGDEWFEFTEGPEWSNN